MLPVCREVDRFAYAGYAVVIVEDRVDRDFAAVAKRGSSLLRPGADFAGADSPGEIITGYHATPSQAADEARRMIGERIRGKAMNERGN